MASTPPQTPQGQTQVAWGLKRMSNQCVQIENTDKFAVGRHLPYNIKGAQSRCADVRSSLPASGQQQFPVGDTTNQAITVPLHVL